MPSSSSVARARTARHCLYPMFLLLFRTTSMSPSPPGVVAGLGSWWLFAVSRLHGQTAARPGSRPKWLQVLRRLSLSLVISSFFSLCFLKTKTASKPWLASSLHSLCNPSLLSLSLSLSLTRSKAEDGLFFFPFYSHRKPIKQCHVAHYSHDFLQFLRPRMSLQRSFPPRHVIVLHQNSSYNSQSLSIFHLCVKFYFFVFCFLFQLMCNVTHTYYVPLPVYRYAHTTFCFCFGFE